MKVTRKGSTSTGAASKPTIPASDLKAIEKKIAENRAKARAEAQAAHQAAIKESKVSGEAFAHYFLTHDEPDEGGSLRSAVEDAQELFKDRPEEVSAFYAELERACLPGPRAFSTDQVLRNLDAATTFLCAIRNLAKQQICDGGDDTGATDLSIQALAEKAGYLCDECIREISGGPGCVGDFDAWAEVKPEPEKEAHHD